MICWLFSNCFLPQLHQKTDQDAVIISQQSAETETLRGLLKARTMELEVLRSDFAAAEAKSKEESKAKNEDLF